MGDNKRMRRVLIVPLWNWNFEGHENIAFTDYGSNRTFMELKLVQSSFLSLATESSNRTFMELKYKGSRLHRTGGRF